MVLPWYGGQSVQPDIEYLPRRLMKDWTHIGLDPFYTFEDFNNILKSGRVGQYAYAMSLRMMRKVGCEAAENGQPFFFMGMSYGANLISAFMSQLTNDDIVPNGLIGIEGGKIRDTTLNAYFRDISDPRMIDMLERRDDILPFQRPIPQEFAHLAGAIINPRDKVAMGQEEIWSASVNKMYIGEHGPSSHYWAPFANQRKVRAFISAHFQSLLT